MDIPNPLQAAINQIGLIHVAKACDVSHQAVRKWQRQGRLPRTEWTGETRYAHAIEAATGGQVSRASLLTAWPKAAAEPEARHAA